VRAGLVLLAALASTPGEKSASEHLLAGAQAFREARYDEALVEFRVAQALGIADAGAYAAASLVKLGRAEDAVEAFGAAVTGHDALLDYYRAVACYEARLYLCADQLLALVGERSGPLVSAQAAKLRAAIASELAEAPPTASIDWYLERCAERRARRPALAAAYCREAAALAKRRPDRYREGEAAARLSSLETSAQPGVAP
jgi:hypothetical protein